MPTEDQVQETTEQTEPAAPAPLVKFDEPTERYEAAGGTVEIGAEQAKFTPAADDATEVKASPNLRTEKMMTKFEEEQEAGRRAVARHAERAAYRVPTPKSPVELQIEATTPPNRTFNPAEHVANMFSKNDKERGYKQIA